MIMIVKLMMKLSMWRKSTGMEMAISDTVSVSRTIRKGIYFIDLLLIQSIGTTERNRDEELIKLLQTDTNDEKDMTKLW